MNPLKKLTSGNNTLDVIKNGHERCIRASELSYEQRFALANGNDIYANDDSIIVYVKKSHSNRSYFKARLAPGFSWTT